MVDEKIVDKKISEIIELLRKEKLRIKRLSFG